MLRSLSFLLLFVRGGRPLINRAQRILRRRLAPRNFCVAMHSPTPGGFVVAFGVKAKKGQRTRARHSHGYLFFALFLMALCLVSLGCPQAVSAVVYRAPPAPKSPCRRHKNKEAPSVCLTGANPFCFVAPSLLCKPAPRRRGKKGRSKRQARLPVMGLEKSDCFYLSSSCFARVGQPVQRQ